MRKKIYEDVLDDIDEIKPEVAEADGERAYVTERFDEEEYSLIFKFVPWFCSECADLEPKLSLVASLFREILSPDFKISPIYADTEWLRFSDSGYAVMLSVGVVPSHRITLRRALRILLSLDGIGRISMRMFASSVSMSEIPSNGRISMYNPYGNTPAKIFDKCNKGNTVTALVREAAGASGKNLASDKLYMMCLAISGMSGSPAQRERFDEAVASAAASLSR